MEIYGDTGTGRTTLALTAPGPIALIHASEKIEGIIQPFARDKEIRLFDFGVDLSGARGHEAVADEADKVWGAMSDAIYDAYEWARTIIIDTHTEAWELIRLARFGDLKPSGGRIDANYGPVNAEWRSLFKHFRHQDGTNLIAVGQTKDEYRESKSGMGQRTGKTIRAGQKDVHYLADVIVRTERDIIANTFTSKVEKGWWNAFSEGLEFDNEDSRFGYVMAIVAESDEEEWLT